VGDSVDIGSFLARVGVEGATDVDVETGLSISLSEELSRWFNLLRLEGPWMGDVGPSRFALGIGGEVDVIVVDRFAIGIVVVAMVVSEFSEVGEDVLA